jgi:hypothetical protein
MGPGVSNNWARYDEFMEPRVTKFWSPGRMGKEAGDL